MMKKSIKFADDLVEKSDEREVDKDDKKDKEGKEQSKWSVHNFRQARPSIIMHEPIDYSPQRGAVNVEVRLIILKLSNISTKQSRFSCEAFMEASWYDKELVVSKNEDNDEINENEIEREEETGIKYDEKRHWNPMLYIQNVIDHQSQDKWYNVEKTPIGYKVSEKRRFKGEFYQTFDLRSFPLDLQELCISIGTFHSSNEIQLRQNQEKLSSINTSTFGETHEWQLYSAVCERKDQKQQQEEQRDDQQSPLLDLTICIVRKPNYYYWNSFFLVFVIAMLCLCSFSIRCDLTSYRLWIAMTVLLSLVTFKWTATKSLPSVSYLTCLDQYALMNILFGFAVCAYYAIFGGLAQPLCVTPSKEIDFYVFVAAISFFYLINSLFIIRFVVLKYRNQKRVEQRQTEYERNSFAKRARIKSIFQNN